MWILLIKDVFYNVSKKFHPRVITGSFSLKSGQTLFVQPPVGILAEWSVDFFLSKTRENVFHCPQSAPLSCTHITCIKIKIKFF